MKFYTAIVVMWSSTFAYAQSAATQMGARAAGMAYASTTLSDGWSLFNNPGGIAVDVPSSSFAYEVTPNLPGGSRMAASIVLPSKPGTFAAGVFKFGDAVYSEQIVTAGFGSRLGITSLGAKVNYVQYAAAGFQTQNAVSISFGGITAITKQILVGAYITNLNQAHITDTQLLPTKLVAGFSIKPQDHFLISTEIEKDLMYDATWKTGAEYTVNKKIFFRSGFNINPLAGFFGIGMNSKRIVCDFAMKLAQVPGNSFQASATYKLRRESNP